MRERGPPRLTGAVAYIDAGRGAEWRQPAMTAGVRAGACIHAQRPRPAGTAAVARARLRGSRQRVAARLPHWGLGNGGVRFGIRNGLPLGRLRLSEFRRAGRRDSAAANERRRPYGKANGCHTGAGFYHPVTPVRQPLPYRMACFCTRRECEPVAVFGGSRQREAARLPHWGHENGGERDRHARSLRRGGRCAGRRDSAAANERRRPYRSGCGRLPPSACDWHRPQGLPRVRRVVSPRNAAWQAGSGAGMACARTRREC